MPDITVSDDDRRRAEDFLVQVLTDMIPDADFSRGSVTRDHTVSAVAAVFALVRKEATNVRNATSLRLVANIEDDQEFTQAVDNIVSNWFLTRKSGTRVRGTVTIHFTQQEDGRIPAATRFVKAPGIIFRLNRDDDFFYRDTDLSPVTNSTGEIVSYTLRVPVIAKNVGSQYEIDSGRFAFVDRFSPYLAYAENETAFTGATDPESPTQLLERAEDSISKRDLSTVKSISAVLQEEFPDISKVVVHGFGDEGMRRDLLNDPTAYYQIHLGGHVDVYVSTPTEEDRVYEASVGGIYTDPREGVTLFRDDTIVDWRRYVNKGDVIRIHNARSSEPKRYLIEKVTKHYVEVHARQPFPDVRPVEQRRGALFTGVRVLNSDQVRCVNANFSYQDAGRWIRLSGSTAGNDGDYYIEDVDVDTDTVTLDTTALNPEVSGDMTLKILEGIVEYSVGDQAPNYDNLVSKRTTGKFSKSFQEDGVVVLPQEPINLVREVSVLDPSNPNADPVTGRLEFPTRVNRSPEPTGGSDLEYQIDGRTPHLSPSYRQLTVLNLRFSPEYDGTEGFISFDKTETTFEDRADGGYTFSADDVGKKIVVSEAYYSGNRGEFNIYAVNNGIAYIEDEYDASFDFFSEKGLVWTLEQPIKFNGNTVRVVYDTALQFDAIDTYVSQRENRVVAANTLIKGFHPVYLEFEIVYSRKRRALEFLGADEASRFLENYINSFPEDEVIHASDIVSAFTQEFNTVVGSVQLPMEIKYTLYAPDGRRISYKTLDAVSLDRSKLLGSADEDRLEDPREYGISEDTVRYLSDASLITVTEGAP